MDLGDTTGLFSDEPRRHNRDLPFVEPKEGRPVPHFVAKRRAKVFPPSSLNVTPRLLHTWVGRFTHQVRQPARISRSRGWHLMLMRVMMGSPVGPDPAIRRELNEVQACAEKPPARFSAHSTVEPVCGRYVIRDQTRPFACTRTGTTRT